MNTREPIEPYLSAKELAEEFRVRSIRPCSREAMRILIHKCPQSVGMQVRLSDAVAFMHPSNGFKPRSNKPHEWRGTARNDATRGITLL